MTKLEFIKKWKISMPMLAGKLGISTGGFNNKLRGNKAYFFTDSEKANLKSVLKELAKDIEKVK